MDTSTPQTMRVLMVDDEDVLCHGVRRVLEPYRFEIPEAQLSVSFEIQALGSAEELLQQFECVKPDLILLDYKLPKRTGLDALTELKSRLTDCAVIMVTAYASLETAVKATKLGAYDFLAKPFSPEELRSVTRKAAHYLLLSRLAREMEERRKKVRFEFLSVLAHELKAPLNAVEGYMELLQGTLTGDPLMMVTRSRARIDGMRKLIYDLLDLTRIESGLKKRDLTTIDLVPLFQRAIEAIQNHASQRRIKILTELPARLDLLADPGEIEIILNNLIGNAVKYNRDGGSVAIRAQTVPNGIRICVKDTGIGILPEDQAKLFQEFVRIKNEQTRAIPGSGLGLSTVKKLIRLYEGDIQLESRWQEGTQFTVFLKEGATRLQTPNS